MNAIIEEILRAKIKEINAKYKHSDPNRWNAYNLCVIVDESDFPDLKVGTITLAKYHPATFVDDAHCDVIKFKEDCANVYKVTRVNSVRFV